MKRRLPAVAFGVLVAATVFAFFLTDSLKTNNSWLHGEPKPVPLAFNPVHGRSVCPAKYGPLDYRRTSLSIELYSAGTLGVSVVDNAGDLVATISPGRFLKANTPSVFYWRGFENGGTYAPPGTYLFQLLLVKQGRTIDFSWAPVTVITHDPTAPATSVALTGAGTGKTSGPVVLTPPAGSVTVHYRAGVGADAYRRVWIDVYRSNASGHLKRVFRFPRPSNSDSATWAGNLAGGRPAPAGTYLIGVSVEDLACDPGSYPVTQEPSVGTTPGAGVTVRYLSATPPLIPTPAGARATVQVDSPLGPYTWALRVAGDAKVVAHGQGAGSAQTGEGTLQVRLPKHRAALYTLTLSAGEHSTSVPLVASATGAQGTRARVLVVLPMLTWQGENAVDDTGDGVPSTLTQGDQITLDRPFSQGLPRGLGQDADLISYLKSQHLRFQLTTDIALAENVGPSLVDRWGVALAGSETWLPGGLASALKGFAQAGGRVLALGTDSLTGSSEISGYPSDPVASVPSETSPDLFGAKHGRMTPTGGDLITELDDQLDILSASPAFSTFKEFQPIAPPTGVPTSVAGIADGAPAVTVFKDGSGYVAEVGLPNFNSTLAADVDSQDLFNRLWQLLAK